MAPGELWPRVGFIVTNLTRPNRRAVKFYNGRGTAEQPIKEGKNAIRERRWIDKGNEPDASRARLQEDHLDAPDDRRDETLTAYFSAMPASTTREKLTTSARSAGLTIFRPA